MLDLKVWMCYNSNNRKRIFFYYFQIFPDFHTFKIMNRERKEEVTNENQTINTNRSKQHFS